MKPLRKKLNKTISIVLHSSEWKVISTILLAIIVVICLLNGKIILASLLIMVLVGNIGIYRKKQPYTLNEDLFSVIDNLTRLISTAKNEIQIFSGSINPNLYCHSAILSALQDAKNKHVKITIITNYEKALKRAVDSDQNQIFDLIRNFEIKLYDYGSLVDEYSHFIVADSKCFRLERDLQTRNSGPEFKRPAIIAHNESFAHKLNLIFNAIINNDKTSLINPNEIPQKVIQPA